MNLGGISEDTAADALSACTDEELAARCRDGGIACAPYISELILRYFPFIKKRAAQMAADPVSCDDLVQEGLLGLLNAVKSFDERRGSGFFAFAYSCITNRMKTACSVVNSACADPDGKDGGEDKLTPEGIIISREFVESFDKLLSPLENSIMRLYISGFSCGEIAVRLGITAKSAANALLRARRKLRRELYGGK